MIKEQVSIDEVLAVLNDAVTTDRKAMTDLIEARVSCNRQLANHPTIQVRDFPGEGCRVGVLGILNGIFGIDDITGNGIMAASYDKDGHLVGFVRVEHEGEND